MAKKNETGFFSQVLEGVKGCPFCGSQVIVVERICRLWFTRCKCCQAGAGPGSDLLDEKGKVVNACGRERAIMNWNLRA